MEIIRVNDHCRQFTDRVNAALWLMISRFLVDSLNLVARCYPLGRPRRPIWLNKQRMPIDCRALTSSCYINVWTIDQFSSLPLCCHESLLNILHCSPTNGTREKNVKRCAYDEFWPRHRCKEIPSNPIVSKIIYSISVSSLFIDHLFIGDIWQSIYRSLDESSDRSRTLTFRVDMIRTC